jgi:uncharacterized protein YggE
MRQMTGSLALGALLLTAPHTMATVAAQDNPTPQVPSIVTSGEATVRRAPDQAFVTVAVETRARNPKDAQRTNAEAMTAVQQKLAEIGIAKDAVRTTGYNVQQEFDFSNGRRTPRDFVARNGLEVRIDAVERVGEVLDVTVTAGATSVGGVRFEIKDRAGAEREALRLAVVDARARAEAMATGAGRTLDRILRIDDSRQPQYRPAAPQMMAARAGGMADAAPPPIEAGLIEIRADVTLTIAIK